VRDTVAEGEPEVRAEPILLGFGERGRADEVVGSGDGRDEDDVVTDSSNATAGYTYNGVGMTSLTAYLTGGGVQETMYNYGVHQSSGSAIDSNDIVGATDWPDPAIGLARGSQQEGDVNAL